MSSISKRIASLNAASQECWEATHVVEKAFWVMVFMTCSTLMIYNCAVISNDYFKFETQTKLELRSHDDLRFPTVAVCVEAAYNPKQFIRHPKLAKVLDSGSANSFHEYVVFHAFNVGRQSHGSKPYVSYVPPIVKKSPRHHFLRDQSFEQYEELYADFTSSMTRSKILKFWTSLIVNCSETFSGCRVGLNEFDCCAHVIATVLYKAFGCFILDPPAHLTQNVPERRRSLQLYLTRDQVIPTFLRIKGNIKVQWAVYLYSEHCLFTRSKMYIFALEASRNDTVGGEYSPFETDPLLFEQNTVNAVSIDPSYTTLLGYPYQPACNDTPTGVAILNGRYYANGCYFSCELRHMEQKCGCIRVDEDYNITNAQFCSPLNTSCTVTDVEDLHCICPIPCKFNKFIYKVNSRINDNTIPSEFTGEIENDIKSNKSLENINGKNLDMIVEIFYNSLVTEHIVQVPRWSLSTVVSSIGAQFALWMGIKIITVLQFLYYFTSYCKAKNQTKHEDEPDHLSEMSTAIPLLKVE